ncbi:MAG: hypothetical protein HKM01_03055 [Gallionella sp.]|nr:hypothetical protein [Gallionella sp.]
MISIDLSDLPLLTEIVDTEHESAVIPTLTEVVPATILPPVSTPSNEPAEAAETMLQQNFASHSIEDTAANPIWNASPETPSMPSAVAIAHNISKAEMQQLIDHFETHLESVFTEKLNRHLEQLHHQAVKLAISELKGELPGLLNKVLNASDIPR